MRIPGRLRDTTLGDVLGGLHRARATGFLELRPRGPNAGDSHRIQLEEGKVVGLLSSAGPRLGELLQLGPLSQMPNRQAPHGRAPLRSGEDFLSRGLISAGQLKGALAQQLRTRLEILFQLEDADLRFHVPRPRTEDPTAPDALAPTEFLPGRPRKRQEKAASEHASSEDRSSRSTGRSRSDEALRTLGLSQGATRVEVQRAFRALAQKAHPDRHPSASDERRLELMRQFAALSHAYHVLTA